MATSWACAQPSTSVTSPWHPWRASSGWWANPSPSPKPKPNLNPNPIPNSNPNLNQGFELRDPEGLLGGSEGGGNEGFTVALLERGHEGLDMGPRHAPMNSNLDPYQTLSLSLSLALTLTITLTLTRHAPMNSAFMNGTVKGDGVWIPMESILGGQTRCGYGWHMFVECLAEGRGVSLPAGAMGAARSVAAGVGAYTRVRKQFKVP